MERLEAALRERGILVFARIDFSADAARAGLTLVQRHGLADALAANLAATVPLIERAAAAA